MVTINLIEESKSWVSLPRFIGKKIHIMTIHYKPIIFMGSKSKEIIFFIKKMTWQLMWRNVGAAELKATLQLLVIY